MPNSSSIDRYSNKTKNEGVLLECKNIFTYLCVRNTDPKMELETFIANWLQAWTGNNPKELLAYYAEDSFYSDPAKPNCIDNKEELEIYFTKLLAKNPNWVWQAVEIIPTAKGCTLKWKAEIPIGTEILTLFGLDIIEINKWKISRNEVYFDRTPWVEALKRQKNLS